MIVDDEPANTLLLERLFEMVGVGRCKSTNDPREAMALLQEFQPDVILLDLSMPHIDGFELLELFHSVIPEGTYLPILVLTADATGRAKQRALKSGANDFVTKPFNNAEVVLRVRNLLETRRLHCEMRRSNENLEAVVAERTSELRAALSELRDAQQQVIQQERLRALGTMASGVAHDFNNSLSIILGFGEFVLRICEQHHIEDAVEQMKIVLTTAEDAAQVVGRLRSFYREDSDVRERLIDLRGLVEQAVTITEPRWKTQAMGKGIAIDIQLELETTPRIWGHASELREVLTNLIFNAVDAMPAGGSLTFHTGVEDDSVILSVKDSGIGMPEEVRRRCLEPFFTTKGEHGSGLGLAMVYGIVQRHRGEMEILSKAGQGTTFIFRFPASIAADKDTCPASGAAVERSLRVLVVEDQELIRKIIVNNLGDDLHDITTAANADEALDILGTEDFDLIVTDQAMPGMNGAQLADAIKRINPETRVILLTGFGTESEGGQEGSGVDLVLEKPISQAAFRTAVAQVMSTAHQAPAGLHEPAQELSQTA